MEKEQPIKILYGIWYAIFILGLNSAKFLAISDKLIYIFLLFLLVELMVPKKGYIINIFLALLIIQSINYPGKFYTFQWVNWFFRDVSREFFSINDGNYYIPILAMCINLIVIILMQALFTRTCLGSRGGTMFLCLGTALLAIVYIEQEDGRIIYILSFVILGLLIKATDLIESTAPYSLGRLLRNSTIWISVLMILAFVLPGYDTFDVGDRFRKEVIFRHSIFSYSKNKAGYNSFDGDLGGHLIEDSTPVLRINSPVPVYLKGETKSHYTGRGWEAGIKYAVSSLPAVGDVYLPLGKEIYIKVQVLSPTKILYVPRYPKRISLAKGYRILYPKDINIDAYPYEYYIYRSNLRTGDEYKITALIPTEDLDFLRRISNTKVDIRYLALDNIPKRVQQLAKDVVQGNENGYDKAMSLVSFLRYGKWEYSTDTTLPPRGGNFVEHFLFELKSGYCVHFSTAFVLMARSVGLPARWVKGYNYGIYEERDSYLICNNHAHSWAEIWFDDYGWVPFEATPENPHLQRTTRYTYRELIEPEGRWERGIYEHEGIDWQDYETKDYSVLPDYISIAFILLFIITIAIYFWYDRSISIEVYYDRIQSRLKLFGWQRCPWETPREHLKRVHQLPKKLKFKNFIYQFEEIIYGGKNELKNKDRELSKAYSYLGLLIYRLIKRKKS